MAATNCPRCLHIGAIEEPHQKPAIELPLLLQHESRRLDGSPRFLIGSFSRQRVIDVADGGNANRDTELIAGQSLRISLAVYSLMMIKGRYPAPRVECRLDAPTVQSLGSGGCVHASFRCRRAVRSC
jgi:hypothetical protein